MAGEGGPAGGSDEGRRAALVAAARERFVALARKPDREIDLAEAALLIAAEEYPGLDVAAYQRKLTALSQRVRERLVETARAIPDSDEAALRALHDVLFREEGFAGAQPATFHDPRHSFLNQVIDTKRGLPITLCVVYCEVAWRADLDAAGINLPGRFIAQFRGEHLSVYVNPFEGGEILPADRRALAERVFGQPLELTPEQLAPASRKQILVRILGNLLGNYLRVRPPELAKALAAVERMLAVSPAAEQIRDRGAILRAMGMLGVGQAAAIREDSQEAAFHTLEQAARYLGAAWLDLRLYTRLAEGRTDTAEVDATADQLWRLLGKQN